MNENENENNYFLPCYIQRSSWLDRENKNRYCFSWYGNIVIWCAETGELVHLTDESTFRELPLDLEKDFCYNYIFKGYCNSFEEDADKFLFQKLHFGAVEYIFICHGIFHIFVVSGNQQVSMEAWAFEDLIEKGLWDENGSCWTNELLSQNFIRASHHAFKQDMYKIDLEKMYNYKIEEIEDPFLEVYSKNNYEILINQINPTGFTCELRYNKNIFIPHNGIFKSRNAALRDFLNRKIGADEIIPMKEFL
jgi:hypothetical protein